MSKHLTRKSDSQANAEALARRSSTYADDSAHSWTYTQDRIKYRPVGKKRLLRWAQREARFDGPMRVHGRGVADDGAPKMTGEALRYLGMLDDTQGRTDWVNVACQRDDNGDYITPMRCAIAKIGVRRPKTAAMLSQLVIEFCDEQAAVDRLADPEVEHYVVKGALDELYDSYTSTPRPTKTRHEVVAA